MLTRLKVEGFKNLRSLDLRFGFFTCIAGLNGVGKSNLFDAIQFLSALASMPILNAASQIRGVPGRHANLSDLFGPATDSDGVARIKFEAQAVVPKSVKDEYGQDVTVRCTCMLYTLHLKLLVGLSSNGTGDRIEIEREELVPKQWAYVNEILKFPGVRALRPFVVGQKSTPLIETFDDAGVVKIKLRSDSAHRMSAPTKVPLTTPRTVLSSVDSADHASHLGMKREMQAWRLLQLEPSALRAPDHYNGDSVVTEQGGHLPNALRRIQLNGHVARDVADLGGLRRLASFRSFETRLQTALATQLGGNP